MNSNIFKYGNSVDTDVIFPSRYLALYKQEDLAAHCMEDLDADFSKLVEKDDIIVAGDNFGCGSSREHAPIAIKASGVKVVIAASFARIFYRNAINIGLPILESPAAAAEISMGDEVKVDLDTGVITDVTTGKHYTAGGFPPFIQNMINAGGLLNYLANRQ